MLRDHHQGSLNDDCDDDKDDLKGKTSQLQKDQSSAQKTILLPCLLHEVAFYIFYFKSTYTNEELRVARLRPRSAEQKPAG